MEVEIVEITFISNGKKIKAWPTSKEDLKRLHEEGLILNDNGRCTCGSADFCDHYAHRWMRCFHITSDECQLFTTDNYCD
ncbi:hypothetical protein GCM10028816_51870 [Spirosoma lituiforme]